MPIDRWPEDKQRGYHEPPTDSTLIFLGSVETWWPASLSSVNLVSFNGQPLLTFNRIGDALEITALVFDKEGKIIAKIEDGEFTVNQNNYFMVERPDAHTLRVIDQRNQSALFVHYLNRRAIYITGEFYGSHGEYIGITDGNVVEKTAECNIRGDVLGRYEALPRQFCLWSAIGHG